MDLKESMVGPESAEGGILFTFLLLGYVQSDLVLGMVVTFHPKCCSMHSVEFSGM